MADTVLPYTANAIVSHALKGDGSTYVPKYVGWATASFTPTRALTSLPNEDADDREEGSLTIETISQAEDTLVCSATLTADGNKTIYGAGWFTSGGIPMGITSFSGIPLTLNQQIAFVWKLTGK